MKTSINIPDQLHDQAQDLAPEIPFGELVRDALVLALPLWKADAAGGPAMLALKVRLRAAEAAAGLEGVGLMRRQRKPRATPRPPAPPAPVPATPPTRRKVAAPKSGTKARSMSDYDRSESRSQARSPRK